MSDIPDRVLELYPMISSGTIRTPHEFNRVDFDYLLYGIEYAREYRINKDLPITFLITGNGGELDLAFAMVDILEQIDVPTKGVVVGYAHSSHADFWLGCTYWDMLPSSFIGLHPTQIGTSGSSESELTEFLKEVKSGNQQICNLLARRSNAQYDIEYWQQFLNRVKDGYIFVNRQEAETYGFIEIESREPARENHDTIMKKYGLTVYPSKNGLDLQLDD